MKKKLIELTIKKPNNLSYINLDENNNYKGWVADFGLVEKATNKAIGLDLKNENDLFLLFVLASAWSKTGPWENAVFFTTYLKFKNYKITDWLNKNIVQNEIHSRENNAKSIIDATAGIKSRSKVAFRKDFYSSVAILAENWEEIKAKMNESAQKSDWLIFIDHLRSLKGLGEGTNKMKIKIPLILRELRCQNIYPNIDGKYCCVPDERVKEAYKSIGEKMPHNYLKASEYIYKDFKDLYDIPLFAYKDFKEAGLL